MIGLTERQREVIDFIHAYIAEKSYSPSIGEIADHFAVSHPCVLMHLRALQKKKIIRRTSRARSIVIIKPGTPAPTSSGFCTIECYENESALLSKRSHERVFIAPDLINSDSFQQLFAIRVNSDYPELSILSGDLLIVRRQSIAAPDDKIIIAKNDKLIPALHNPNTDTRSILGHIIALQRHFNAQNS